ncbi:MAG: DUF3795 domain-containing protein [Thermodesulfobacteriota bacterium]
MSGYSHSQLTAYCGLYCGDCLRFDSRALRLARELEAELDQGGWEPYAQAKAAADPAQVRGAAQFAHWPQFRALLASLASQACAAPCRLGGDGCAGPCGVKACCLAKGLEGCWQCPQFRSCPELKFLLPLHGQNLLDNLELLQSRVPEQWAPQRRGFYAWS